jgi:hypothetical protein
LLNFSLNIGLKAYEIAHKAIYGLAHILGRRQNFPGPRLGLGLAHTQILNVENLGG